MSQLDVNIIAPLGYAGPNLVGDNNFVQIVDNTGDTIFKSPGLNNLAIGSNTMTSTTGANNIALGNLALKDNTIGDLNIAIGQEAMSKNISGQTNIAIGEGALSSNPPSTPSFNDANVAIGFHSLRKCVQGSANVAIGSNSGFSIENGIQNVFIGIDAGSLTTNGSNNVCLGYDAKTATATTNNSITLGNSSHTVIRAAVTTITSLSDERDKKNITDLSAGLDFVKGLKPVEFVWDDRDESGKHDVKDFGFIAQDLKKSQEDAELAETLKLVYEENPDKLEASYGKLVPILVKAIQELTAKVEALESK